MTTRIYFLIEHDGYRLSSWEAIAVSLDKKSLEDLAIRRSRFSDNYWKITQRTLDELKPKQIKYLI